MEHDLQRMLRNLSPCLGEEEYLFCMMESVPPGVWEGLGPVAMIREEEGTTLILSRDLARREGIAGAGPFRRITLELSSSLEAVGLTAALSAVLAEAGIAANMLAGYHHDHLFVPADRAKEAMEILESLHEEADLPDEAG